MGDDYTKHDLSIACVSGWFMVNEFLVCLWLFFCQPVDDVLIHLCFGSVGPILDRSLIFSKG